MPSTATITGKIGPADTLTATVFTGVTSFSLDTVNGVLNLVCDQGRPQIDVYAQTTLTLTVSSHVYTLTISA